MIPIKYRGMASQIPEAIRGQRFISLTTYRKNGAGVRTPLWFGEDLGNLYIMTRSYTGKIKRVRNISQARVAACTFRGKVTGPEFAAHARILPSEDHARARATITRKYWLARITAPWSRADAFLEISFPESDSK